MNKMVIACKDLHKKYVDGARQVQVLTGVNLAIDSGESVAILGPSGSGKSTLLHLLGGLDTPTSGEVFITGEKVDGMTEKKRSKLRNQKLGFVYQFHHLLAEFTLLENVAMPLLVRGNQPQQARESAEHILKQVGLEHRLNHKISQLSGGERQRTAIARALVTKPACVLADEPTGNLDNHTAEHVYNAMVELNKQLNTSLLIVTHDTQLAKKMDRRLVLEDGVIH